MVLKVPPMMLPPFCSKVHTFPNAAFILNFAGSPAYTPEQKGSIKRSNTSSPRLRRTNSSTDSSRPGGEGRNPRAPSPALILPEKLMRSKKGRSVGLEGTGLNFPFQSTKRGAFGSPSTKSSFNPLSTAMVRTGSEGWKLFGPSSHR
uniref:Uncharacterized protein n=1 Tax=Opuntia streptacantha TaxID=393608 RepID=A0A7C9AZJ3_OPUST